MHHYVFFQRYSDSSVLLLRVLVSGLSCQALPRFIQVWGKTLLLILCPPPSALVMLCSLPTPPPTHTPVTIIRGLPPHQGISSDLSCPLRVPSPMMLALKTLSQRFWHALRMISRYISASVFLRNIPHQHRRRCTPSIYVVYTSIVSVVHVVTLKKVHRPDMEWLKSMSCIIS